MHNEFAWSLARYKSFQTCARQYYFNYYGYWNGWSEAAPERTRTIYVLKKLKHRQAWAGQHVHNALASVLRAVSNGKEPPTPEEIIADMLARMREEFKASRAGLYRKDPQKHPGLFEHEYGTSPDNAEWKNLADRAVECVHAFYRLPIFERLKNPASQPFLAVEDLLKVHLDNLPVLVKMDVVYRDGDTLVVCDWKTVKAGGREEDRLQAACYALATTARWKQAPDHVKTTWVALPTGHMEESRATPDEVEEMRSFIQESADEMLFPLTDPENNLAEDEDAFELTDNRQACARCNFLKVCPRLAELSGRGMI